MKEEDSNLTEYIEELLQELSDPFHKRLIQAHKGENSLKSMEDEMVKILREIINRED